MVAAETKEMPGGSLLPLVALAIATFAIGTTELVVMGLLPNIAEDLDVTIPEAGLLVTGYAVGVVLSAPIMAIVTNGVARKATLIGLMVIFVAGNVLCALSTGYFALLAARIFTSIAHAAFFGIASVVATTVVGPQRRAVAVATVFGGVTVAVIVGVPLGTAVGRAFGWHATFWMVAAIGTLAVLAIAIWLPANIRTERGDLWKELSVLRDRQVLLALVVTALSWGSLFAVFTYITPILEDVTQVSEEAVIWVLFIFGVSMTIGNFLGGRLADWHLLPSIVGMIAGIAVLLVIVAVVIDSVHLAVISLVAWGLFVFALGPALQTWVVSAAEKAPYLASTINQASFHIGSAGGAWIGASALSFGVTYDQLPWLGVILTVIALAVAVLAVSLELRRQRIIFAGKRTREAL